MKRVYIAGFSLIELLVVILIMGTIGSVVIACFMGGMRAYERVHDFGRGEADVYLAFEMMERDLKNAVSLPGEPFVGDGTLMQFPAMESVTDLKISEGGVNVVRYWDDPEKGLLRSIDDLGEKNSYSAVEDQVTSGRVEVQFEYMDEDSAGGWVDVWQSVSNLPQQVHISFHSGGDGEDGVVFERVLFLPGS